VRLTGLEDASADLALDGVDLLGHFDHVFLPFR
jgi:hypothetical protein